MNGDVFTHWLKSDQRMALQDRKICIIMDNAKAMIFMVRSRKLQMDLMLFLLSYHYFVPSTIVKPLDQGVIAKFKMCYKRKLVAWTTQQIDNSNEDLTKQNVDLFQAMLWCVMAWHKLDDQIIRNYWRKSTILPVECNADFNNSDERIKSKLEKAALELGNLIAALNLGLDVEVKPKEKFSTLEYINMEGEDDFEVEYST